jgi:hypothetical protein
MSNMFRSRIIRFKVGDPVIITGPGLHRGKHGFIMQVIEPSAGDFVYRYRVRFPDGTSVTFFGFELKDKES